MSISPSKAGHLRLLWHFLKNLNSLLWLRYRTPLCLSPLPPLVPPSVHSSNTGCLSGPLTHRTFYMPKPELVSKMATINPCLPCTCQLFSLWAMKSNPPCPSIQAGLWLRWSTEYCRSDTRPDSGLVFNKLGSSFLPAHSGEIQLPGKKLNYPESSMLGGGPS